ncbi:unnamed protein product [Heligmosomoides polygyrus]|uniref:DUF1989 domain-containing protein n=1 Tax=Heligmosomoides polygyrus TaxID=6339 RepID=A0A183GCV4_HELPZ|nr:unnamed protein product [Heligmosomoides polygyrus]
MFNFRPLTNGIEAARRNIPWRPLTNGIEAARRNIPWRVRPMKQAIGRYAGKLNPKPALTSVFLTTAHADGSPQRFLHICDNGDTFGKLPDTVQNETLRETLLRGVGLLHEGMHPKGFQIVGKLQQRDYTGVHCAAYYVLPSENVAYLVVIMDVQFYDGKYQSYEDYPIGDVLHMVRLANRPGRDVDVE